MWGVDNLSHSNLRAGGDWDTEEEGDSQER